MGAAPRNAVKRENSDPGDIIILLGGRTGRDGTGGATGSSRYIQRHPLRYAVQKYRRVMHLPSVRSSVCSRPEVSSLIKKCNDFGAGVYPLPSESLHPDFA